MIYKAKYSFNLHDTEITHTFISCEQLFLIFNDASNSDHTASNGGMIYECECDRIWKETVVVFKGHDVDIYVEGRRKITKRATSRRRLETRISRMQVQGVSATQTCSVLRHNKLKHPPTPKFSAVDDIRYVSHFGIDYMNTRFLALFNSFLGSLCITSHC